MRDDDTRLLDFPDFNEERDAGILFDGVGDVLTLKKHRETLQGRPKCQKGAKSATMKHAYSFTLTRRAVVATMDLSAANMHLLSSDHWLSDSRNIMQLRLTESAFVQPSFPVQEPAEASPQDIMRAWTVSDVVSFLHGADLAGPAATFHINGVCGKDMLNMTQDTLTQDLKLSTFAAAKVLAARDGYVTQ